MKTRRTALFVVGLLLAGIARGWTFYRLDLVGGGVVFSEEEPKASGGNLVFRMAPQGILVTLRRTEVVRVEQIESENRPPLDLGGATTKQPPAPKSERARDRRRDVAAGGSPSWSPKMPAYRGYAQGDDMPGNRVAFPVSRDDLLPGNYRAFPAGHGGQSGDAPMLEEGRGLPKAGSLAEPPKVLQFWEPPNGANVQVPTVPLVFSEKPRVEQNPSNPAATSPKRQ